MCANLQAKGLARAVSSDLADTSCCNTLIYILDSSIRVLLFDTMSASYYYWSKIAISYQLGGKIGIRKTDYRFQCVPLELLTFPDAKNGPKNDHFGTRFYRGWDSPPNCRDPFFAKKWPFLERPRFESTKTRNESSCLTFLKIGRKKAVSACIYIVS